MDKFGNNDSWEELSHDRLVEKINKLKYYHNKYYKESEQQISRWEELENDESEKKWLFNEERSHKSIFDLSK